MSAIQEMLRVNSWLWDGQRLRKRKELSKNQRWERERGRKGEAWMGVISLVRAGLNILSCHQVATGPVNVTVQAKSK